MSKKVCIRLVVITIFIGFFITFTFLMDIGRIIEKKEPIFSIQKAVYEDGGTIEYIGFGYKIYKGKKEKKEFIKFGSIFSTYESVVGDEVYD